MFSGFGSIGIGFSNLRSLNASPFTGFGFQARYVVSFSSIRLLYHQRCQANQTEAKVYGTAHSTAAVSLFSETT